MHSTQINGSRRIHYSSPSAKLALLPITHYLLLIHSGKVVGRVWARCERLVGFYTRSLAENFRMHSREQFCSNFVLVFTPIYAQNFAVNTSVLVADIPTFHTHNNYEK